MFSGLEKYYKHANSPFKFDSSVFYCPLAEKQVNCSMTWLYFTTVQQFLYTVSFYNLRHDNDFCYFFFSLRILTGG